MTNKPINRISRADVNRYRAMLAYPEQYVPLDAMYEYQRIAITSAIYPGKGTPFGLMYAALGLAEAGEVQNKVKKAFRDDGVITFEEHELQTDHGPMPDGYMSVSFKQLPDERRAQIIKELGGVLWCIAAVCDEIGASMSDVALKNLEELCSRGERGTLQGDGDDR